MGPLQRCIVVEWVMGGGRQHPGGHMVLSVPSPFKVGGLGLTWVGAHYHWGTTWTHVAMHRGSVHRSWACGMVVSVVVRKGSWTWRSPSIRVM